jgi:hypothetical protein
MDAVGRRWGAGPYRRVATENLKIPPYLITADHLELCKGFAARPRPVRPANSTVSAGPHATCKTSGSHSAPQSVKTAVGLYNTNSPWPGPVPPAFTAAHYLEKPWQLSGRTWIINPGSRGTLRVLRVGKQALLLTHNSALRTSAGVFLRPASRRGPSSTSDARRVGVNPQLSSGPGSPIVFSFHGLGNRSITERVVPIKVAIRACGFNSLTRSGGLHPTSPAAC